MNLAKAKRKIISMFRLGKHSLNLDLIKRCAICPQDSKHADETRLDAAIDWLKRAQDISNCGGVPAGYSLTKGWLPLYPETTGYIIQTFAVCAKILERSDLLERAFKMGDWEISIQFPNGAIPGGWGINSYPIVFNTGQVVLGWNTLFSITGERRFIDAAKRACDWLIDMIDEDGCWWKHTYHNVPHAYNSRVAWALLQTNELCGEDKYKNAAKKNIEWVLENIIDHGYFKYMSFENEKPFTHNIAYTISGLVESIPYLPELEARILDAIIQPCDILFDKYLEKSRDRKEPKMLPARFDPHWNSYDRFSCLTGNVQFAQIFYALSKMTGKEKYRQAADALVEGVKTTQSINNQNPTIRGAIAGSFPIFGKYLRFTFPNWATKFFIDALLEKMFDKGISLKDFKSCQSSKAKI